jgi:hypothetical protein
MSTNLKSESGSLHLAICNVQTGAGSVSFEYLVTNSGTNPVFLLNTPLLWRGGKGPEVRTNDVVVTVGEQRVTLAQKLFPVPPGIDVEQPVVPACTLLGAGKSWSRNITVPLPLHRTNPYADPPQPGRRAITAMRPLYFEIGFFTGTDESLKHGTPIPHTTGGFYYFEPMPETAQKTLSVGPIADSVAVELHPDSP